ncbi:Alcohol dehydrogenase [hydrothermal vent metagenome]|uniref:Alcohol dehydrogenase n=2 Tax=hydrothermal vent metagenome TaxID=652676 RepID=A0A3B0S5K3_9ZZZZ
MKAACFATYGGSIDVVDLPDPIPPEGGVVLEVHANGVCRSDWHGWVGHDESISLPHVPGHEMSGVVIDVGPGVDPSFVGRRVVVPFILSCGECSQCASGNHQVCERQYQPGFSGWGAFAPYVSLPYASGNLIDLPEEMTFVTAAGLGCRFATAFRAVVDQGAVSVGTSVAVWGCGGVGLSAVMIASAMGASVIAIDVDQAALDFAGVCGATETVLAGGGVDAVEAVRDLSGGGVDVSLDALGSTQTSVSSIGCLAVRGRHVQVGLMVGEHDRPAIPMSDLHAKEVEFYGSHGMAAWRYPDMLAMIVDGRLDPGALVTETFDLGGGVRHLMSMDTFPGTGFAVITDYPS